MKYKRSFIFIRPTTDVRFYSDTIDFFQDLRSVVPDHIQMTRGHQGPLTEFISFWYPNFADYQWFTDNLYISGDIKNIFRAAMTYAKLNRLAFCLPSVNLQNYPYQEVTRHWYYNIKPNHAKFYDSTPGQKIALNVLTGIMAMPEIIHSVTIFDHDHNVKYTETAVTADTAILKLAGKLLKIQQDQFPKFTEEKTLYNQTNEIIYKDGFDRIVRPCDRWDLGPVSEHMPYTMQTLNLDLTL